MEPTTCELPQRRRMPVERINRHARERGIALGGAPAGGPVYRSKLFTPPVLTPLWHSQVFHGLTAEQQRRYNQLVGMMQNELICFFEQEFGGNVIPALLTTGLPSGLAESLGRFLEEERQHTQMFRALNRAAEPGWYAKSDYHVLRLPGAFLRLLRFVTRRPTWFPMVFWVMLLMEERSMAMSHRYAEPDEGELDPRFAATYRAHAEDEVRHVQIDWHLLEEFYERRPRWLRRLNVKLLDWFMTGLFLKPRRANARVVELMINEHPELAERRSELLEAVRRLSENTGYREMMYSSAATPIAYALFQRLPELAGLRRKLFVEDVR